MKEHDKVKVNYILDQCINSVQFWSKKSSSLHDIENQLNGLLRAKWEVFELEESIRDELQQALEMRITDELKLLSNEMKTLDGFEKSLEPHVSSLRCYCDAQLTEAKDPSIFECLLVLMKTRSALTQILAIMRYALRRISLADMDSFLHLKESNEALNKLKTELEECVCTWKDFVSEIEF